MRTKWLTSIFLVALLALTAAGQPVPLGDRVYTLLDAGYSRGLITDGAITQLPLMRSEVAFYLVEMEDARQDGHYLPSALRDELAQQLRWYKREVDKIVEDKWWTNVTPGKAKLARLTGNPLVNSLWSGIILAENGHILDLTFNENVWLTADPTYAFDYYHLPYQDDVLNRRWGFVFEASTADWAKVYLRWRDVAEWGNGPYFHWNVRDALYDNRAGYLNPNAENLVAYEDFCGGVVVEKAPFTLFFGRDVVRWGPGRFGNLMMGGEAPTFAHLKLTANLSHKVRYTYLHGSLHQWPEIADTLYTASSGRVRRHLEEKYIAGHRLDMKVFHWLNLGLEETVVYGERGLDFDYLNPVSVFFSEEHDTGDQDNALMGIDFLAGPFGPFTAWGELVLDDFVFSKLGSDNASNKIGWLGGGAVQGPGGWLPLEAMVEYAGLRPFMYSHFYPINVYKQWNSSLGLSLQPNSDRLSGSIAWQPYQPLRFGIESHYLRHGANTATSNVGGDIDISRNIDSTEVAPFLDGLRQDSYRAVCWAEYEVFEQFQISGMMGYDGFVDDWRDGGIVASLGVSWFRPVDRPYTLVGRQ